MRPEAKISQFASLISEDNLFRLHVILLAIRNYFYSSAPTKNELDDCQELIKLVFDLGQKYLQKEFLKTPSERTIGRNCYLVGWILQPSEISQLEEKILALQEKWLSEMISNDLQLIRERWGMTKFFGEETPKW